MIIYCNELQTTTVNVNESCYDSENNISIAMFQNF